MLAEVIAPHEALVTYWTREAFLTRVGSKMSRELVGAGKSLAASFPIARVRSFASVRSDMSFQMRAFSVSFTASAERANVGPLLLLPSRRRPGSGRLRNEA